MYTLRNRRKYNRKTFFITVFSVIFVEAAIIFFSIPFLNFSYSYYQRFSGEMLCNDPPYGAFLTEGYVPRARVSVFPAVLTCTFLSANPREEFVERKKDLGTPYYFASVEAAILGTIGIYQLGKRRFDPDSFPL